MRLPEIALILLLPGIAVPPPTAAATEAFDADFTGATLRVDYYHSGTAGQEHIALDRLLVEGPWPGSRTRLIDTSNLGQYLLEVVDRATNRLLYTRGFSSIYGEWETTAPARAGEWGTLAEAVRIPEPRREFQLRLRKRDAQGVFREIADLVIAPESRFVDRPPVRGSDIQTIFENGPPADKVDLLVLGDGYTAAQRDEFHATTRRLVAALFATEPFASRKDDFNVRAIHVPAAESGIAQPRAGAFPGNPLGARYNTFDSERYVLTLDDRAWRDVAAAAPYDNVLILVNESQYGGGGIFNLYSTAAAGSAFAPYLVVHEFAHHFAALADEYFTSSVAYDTAAVTVEPWEPNVTAHTAATTLKWADLLQTDTPLPTPWDHEAYAARSHEFQERRRALREEGAPESRLEELFREEQALFTRTLSQERHAGSVGAFEGAMYRARGLYRPEVDCIMFTRDEVGFCRVCRRAIERVIDLQVGP